MGNKNMGGRRVDVAGNINYEVYTMKKFFILSLALLIVPLVLVAGCTAKAQVPNAKPSVTFTTEPSAINPGDSSNLTWNVTGANSVSIDHGIGVVNTSGTIAVAPVESTTYTLTATNDVGTITRYAVATINPPEPQLASFRVTNVVASISPATFTGACPRTFTLNGTITATAAGTVSYRWERDDIRYSDVQTMTFTTAGSLSTTKLWEFGETSSGWVKLHVLTGDVSSSPVTYSLTCN